MIPFLMILAPVVVAGLIPLIPARLKQLHRGLALVGSLVSLVLGIVLWFMYPVGFEGYLEGYWASVQWQWFPRPLGATFHLGVDGISLIFGLLSALLTVLVVLFSWRRIDEQERGYLSCVMLVSAAMLGVFFARDLLVFYLFWEAILIPMYFLVGIWGGERRIYASMKFVLFTLSGSLLMLVAMVTLFWLRFSVTGTPSMAIVDFYQMTFDPSTAFWLFAGFSLAFAIKTPLFPVHTWLPDAHTEAPSAGSVILAGILLKVGIYGFIRLLIPIFPGQAIIWGGFLSALGVIGIIYGGLVAWVQEDVKKLVAYSSISHLGFVVLGLFALNTSSVTGGLLQGAIHGINTGALFLMVGMLYTRTHTREIDSIGGLADQLPVYSTFLCIFAFASIGLPSTNGFVGEFMILSSSFGQYPWLTVLATGGVIVSALYMLYLLRACVFSDRTESVESLSDLNRLELVTLVPLLILVFWIGLYPSPVIDRLEPTVDSLLRSELPAEYKADTSRQEGAK